MRRRLLPPLLLLVAACTGGGPAPTSAPVPAVPATPAPAPAPTTGPAQRCFPDDAGPEAFVDGGVIGTAGGPGGDARVLSEFRLGSPRPAPGDAPARCERLVVELATAEGAPATSVGVAGVELLADRGILRITLPPIVGTSVIADTVLEGHLVERVFAIRDVAGGLTVDAHLGATVAAAVAPAGRGRIVVDLRREGPLAGGRPSAGDGVVLLEPGGAAADYPLTVAGYGRSPGGELELRLVTPDAVAGATVAVPDHPWGWFETVFTSGPTGTVGLLVSDLELPLRIG